jgi:FkbM family methyltransferase
MAEVRQRVINVERKINLLLGDHVPLSGANLADLTSDWGDQLYGPRTYAQHGDDLIILNIFDMIKIARPSYLDIGAHDPFKISNTALLYMRGSRGINVEANPQLIKAFRTQRPEDVNLNVGVAPEAGTLTFHMFDERSGLNTFSPEQARRIEQGGQFRVRKKIEVPTMTVTDILDTHWSGGFPDFLSLDVEGLDLDILMSIDFARAAPKLICVEANSAEIGRRMLAFLEAKNYVLFFRAAANLFFLGSEYAGALRP